VLYVERLWLVSVYLTRYLGFLKHWGKIPQIIVSFIIFVRIVILECTVNHGNL